MPHYLFRIGEYAIEEITEMEDETNAPETLINIDKNGTGSMALYAPDAARAEMYSMAHLRIHKNWNNPAIVQLHLN
jgi:hypothetical protein